MGDISMSIQNHDTVLANVKARIQEFHEAQPERLEAQNISYVWEYLGWTMEEWHEYLFAEKIPEREYLDGNGIPIEEHHTIPSASILIDGFKAILKQEENKPNFSIKRHFTQPEVHPFDQIIWEKRQALITKADGEVVFQQDDVEFPSFWSQNATNIVASKYFRTIDGRKEYSVSEMIDRVAGTIARWGYDDRYFDDEEYITFISELQYILVNQLASPNSPVWFNIGVPGSPNQSSACFLLTVDDSMESIANWFTEESIIFKGGSGCFTGDTKIFLADGSVRTMEEMYKQGGEVFCYSADVSQFKPTISRGQKVILTKEVRELCEVEIDGHVVRCTPDHLFAVADGNYKQAKDLEEGEILFPLYKKLNWFGYEVVSCFGRHWYKTHFLADEYNIRSGKYSASSGEHRHHIDHNPLNNTPTNIMKLSKREHFLLHGEGTRFTSSMLQERWKNENYRESQLPKFLDGGIPTRFQPGDVPFLWSEASQEKREEFRKKQRENAIKQWEKRSNEERQVFSAAVKLGVSDDTRLKSSLRMQKRSEENKCWLPKARALRLVKSLIDRGVIGSSEQLTEKIYNQYRGQGRGSNPIYNKAISYFDNDRNRWFEQAKAYVNHQVTKVSKIVLNEPVPVYDIQGVEDFHNFAIAIDDHSGIFVHNSGVNISKLRAEDEPLSLGGKASGPLSWMKVADAFAGAIKSGGVTRRAAKLVCMDVDHPDIIKFIWCKIHEEEKARILMQAGYDDAIDGEAYGTVAYQNANHSVRVPDAFMKAVENGEVWCVRNRTSYEGREHRADDIFHQIASAAWHAGDPGIMFDDTTNAWHTVPNSGRISTSNPCGEFVHLDNTACNLSSINLLKFLKDDNTFDIEGFCHTVDVMITAQEILVSRSNYPTDKIKQMSENFRPLGLGYANLGALLMARGLPYDSDEGRDYAASITALMTGQAYKRSAELAAIKGAFNGFELNREPMIKVIEKHWNSSGKYHGDIWRDVYNVWRSAHSLGEKFGYRNAQTTLIAPTGTISFMMDCTTTGVEPDVALVNYKKLVGGGTIKHVNDIVPRALKSLGYHQNHYSAFGRSISQITEDIENGEDIEYIGIAPAHLPVFDCAFPSKPGGRSIAWEGHVKMVASLQPFLSGSISKTINMPQDSTVEDIERAYMLAWKLGCKSIAVYRDGCKQTQVLTTQNTEKETHVEREFMKFKASLTQQEQHDYNSGKVHIKWQSDRGYFVENLSKSDEKAELVTTQDTTEETHGVCQTCGNSTRQLVTPFGSSIALVCTACMESINKRIQAENEEYAHLSNEEVEDLNEKYYKHLNVTLENEEYSDLQKEEIDDLNKRLPFEGSSITKEELQKHIQLLEHKLLTYENTPKPTNENNKPQRKRLPDERQALTHKFSVNGCEGYLTVGLFEDGTPGEIFLKMAKEGSTLSGFADGFACMVSMAFQYGIPLEVMVNKFSHSRFEPSGWTNNEYIRYASSILDYVFRYLEQKFTDMTPKKADDLPSRNPSLESITHAAQEFVKTGMVAQVLSSYHSSYNVCPECGSMLRVNGSCHVCVTCGFNSGCSG